MAETIQNVMHQVWELELLSLHTEIIPGETPIKVKKYFNHNHVLRASNTQLWSSLPPELSQTYAYNIIIIITYST